MQLLKEKLRNAAGWIRRFVAGRRGVSSVEYALIVVAVIGIVGAMGAAMSGGFNNLFQDLNQELTDAIS